MGAVTPPVQAPGRTRIVAGFLASQAC
jgi:hypothetical protein